MAMNILKRAGLCSVLFLSFGAQDGFAQDIIPGTFSGTVSLNTDYVFRGVSQTGETPAIQGGFDYAHDSGFYAGTWASNVDFGGDSDENIEIDFYGGFAGNVTDALSYDVGFARYTYPGVDSSLNFDYSEFFGSMTYDLDYATLGGGLYYSHDFFAGSGDSFYSFAQTSVPLPAGFGASARIGYQTIEDNSVFGLPNYWDWSVGVNYDASKVNNTLSGVTIGLDYTDTDIDSSDCDDGCDARVVGYITKAF